MAFSLFSEHRSLGRFEDTVQAAEDREGEDDLAIFRLLVIATEKVGDGPD